jgi:hypothetical protein
MRGRKEQKKDGLLDANMRNDMTNMREMMEAIKEQKKNYKYELLLQTNCLTYK